MVNLLTACAIIRPFIASALAACVALSHTPHPPAHPCPPTHPLVAPTTRLSRAHPLRPALTDLPPPPRVCIPSLLTTPGEVPWVKTIVDKYHEAAAAKGVRIVPCCGEAQGWAAGACSATAGHPALRLLGQLSSADPLFFLSSCTPTCTFTQHRTPPCAGFDSIPFDLGALLAVRHLAERYGKKTAKVRTGPAGVARAAACTDFFGARLRLACDRSVPHPRVEYVPHPVCYHLITSQAFVRPPLPRC